MQNFPQMLQTPNHICNLNITLQLLLAPGIRKQCIFPVASVVGSMELRMACMGIESGRIFSPDSCLGISLCGWIHFMLRSLQCTILQRGHHWCTWSSIRSDVREVPLSRNKHSRKVKSGCWQITFCTKNTIRRCMKKYTHQKNFWIPMSYYEVFNFSMMFNKNRGVAANTPFKLGSDGQMVSVALEVLKISGNLHRCFWKFSKIFIEISRNIS